MSAQSAKQSLVNRTTAVSTAATKGSAAAPRPALQHVEFLEQYALTNRFSSGRPAGIEITKAGDAVLFLRSGPRSFERNLYEFNVATGTERVLATAGKILGGAKEKSDRRKKHAANGCG